ncbi:MAG: mechanosensitive ion channel domain-containing protein [Cyanobacteriota bacterium]|nr:mechanosensitive ion channel domain-containing protein [Cyanobacteriota bacterium]
MSLLLAQGLGWLGFLGRPFVVEQALVAGLVFAALGWLRRLWRPARAVPPLPLCLLGLPLAMAAAALTERRLGLLLLTWQILLALWGLQLLELVLRRWLAPEAVHALVSRFLRPAFGLIVALELLDAVASLRDLATISLGTWFGSDIALGTLTTVVVVLYFVITASIYPALVVGWLAKRSLALGEGSRKAMVTLLRYTFISLGLIWALARLGIDRTGVLAVAGGLSVGLGFGVKEVFSNFISGLWLLVEGSVRPGEVLIHDGEACEVRRLDLRAATLLRASDNAELVVPNQNFFTATTTTYTRSDRTRRCGFEVTAPSSWTPERMIALLQELALAHPKVLRTPPPLASLLSFSPASHSYRLSFSIVDPLLANTITSDVKLAIWQRFDAEGLLAPPSGEGGGSSQG